MSEAKTYTAADIERYHRGQLSAAERHALEKAALDDPFLADALEGYAATQTPAADLAVLQQKLRLRIEENKKSRGVFYIRTNWMKIAALFILVAGGGWLVLQVFNGNEKTVAVKESPVQSPVSAPRQITTDSTVIPSSEALVKQEPIIKKDKESKTQSNSDASMAVRKPVEQTYQVPPSVLSLPAKDSARNLGYVSREVAAIEEKKAADFSKKATTGEVYKIGRSDARAMDTIRNMNVTLKRTEVAPEETVTLNGRSKGRPQARLMNVIIDSLEPAEGWTNFDDYIADHLKEPDDIKMKGIKGEVGLSFDVNKEGEPVNIAVTQSLCDKCDEEAVRLLKEGPKWKKNKKKGKVKIKFSGS